MRLLTLIDLWQCFNSFHTVVLIPSFERRTHLLTNRRQDSYLSVTKIDRIVVRVQVFVTIFSTIHLSLGRVLRHARLAETSLNSVLHFDWTILSDPSIGQALHIDVTKLSPLMQLSSITERDVHSIQQAIRIEIVLSILVWIVTILTHTVQRSSLW